MELRQAVPSRHLATPRGSELLCCTISSWPGTYLQERLRFASECAFINGLCQL